MCKHPCNHQSDQDIKCFQRLPNFPFNTWGKDFKDKITAERLSGECKKEEKNSYRKG